MKFIPILFNVSQRRRAILGRKDLFAWLCEKISVIITEDK